MLIRATGSGRSWRRWTEVRWTPRRSAWPFLHRRHFALWDVIASCTITGSSDASIRGVTANDFNRLLAETEIKTIVTTGKTAGRCYQKYTQPKTGIEAIVLPSTSPANAAVSFEQLIEAYRFLFEL